LQRTATLASMLLQTNIANIIYIYKNNQIRKE